MTEWPLLEDKQAFETAVLRVDDPVVVAFEQGHCGDCRDRRTLLALVWQQLGWSVRTSRVLADRAPDLADRYRIHAYPTLAVFWRGELVDRVPGPRHPDSVNRRLAGLMAGRAPSRP